MRSLAYIFCLLSFMAEAQAPVFQSSSAGCTDLVAPINGLQVTNCKLSLNAADGSNPGALTAGAQTIGGSKTFTSAIAAPNISGTNTGDVTLGTANGLSLVGQVLSLGLADGTHAGALDFNAQTIGGAKTFTGAISASNLSGTNTGDVTLGASTNGLSLTAQSLQLAAAGAAQAGAVTAGAQTFGGAKTFSSTISASNLSGTNSGDVTIGTANGLSLIGQALSLGLADGTHAGALDFNAQTIGGAKTFNSTIAASNFSGSSAGTNTGDVTISTANGLSLVGQALSMSLAGASTTGTVSSSAQTFGGTKTFNNTVEVGASSANNITIAGGTTGNPVTITSAGSDTNVDVNVITQGSGTLKVNGTAVTVGGTLTVGSPANGLVIASNQITLAAASTSGAGAVINGSQHFGGTKTFDAVGLGNGPFVIDYDSGASGQGGVRITNNNTGRVAEFLQPTNNLIYLKFNNVSGGGGVLYQSTTLPTCNSSFEGMMMTDNNAGGTSGNPTRVCVCVSDGMASPTFAWQNVATRSLMSTSIGTSTTCPN